MSPEKVLIERIKQFCLSNSYLDGCTESYCNGLDVAKIIILEKIRDYENKK